MDCYLDNSATTRPTGAVREAVVWAMSEGFYNPSSLYAPAVAVEQRLEACRQRVKETLSGGDEVVFTSGGTEAANLAITGRLPAPRSQARVLFSAGEHPSVREPCLRARALGYEVLEIPLTREGLTDCEAFSHLAVPQTALICVMEVNNETGAVQPLDRLLHIRDRQCPRAAFHVDGVQGFLRRPPGLFALGVDSYSLSAHKVHGPKGVGALVIRKTGGLQPLLFGGGQEGGLRSGTENTPGIAGLDAAIATFPVENRMRALKLRLVKNLRSVIADLVVLGPDPSDTLAADHIVKISFPPVRAETLLHALESEGVYVGSGSACSSRRHSQSPVLRAMRVSKEIADCALRFSLSPFTTQDEIDRASDCIAIGHRRLKAYIRR